MMFKLGILTNIIIIVVVKVLITKWMMVKLGYSWNPHSHHHHHHHCRQAPHLQVEADLQVECLKQQPSQNYSRSIAKSLVNYTISSLIYMCM